MKKTLRPFWLLCAGAVVTTGFAQITESPKTVAPGKFLIEMGVSKYTGMGVATTFLTAGLTTNWDIQVGADFFLSQKYTQGDITQRNSDVGGLYVRTKWRMINDAEMGTAFAVMPYVKIPTNSGVVGNRSLEGGLILPWMVTLPGVD